MMDVKQIFEWLKLSGKQAFILCVITSTILFSGDEFLYKLALIEAKNSLQIWISLIWLISISVLLSESIFPAFKWISQKIKWHFKLKSYQQRLHALTVEEKKLLSEYIDRNTRTTSIKYSNGVAKELEAAMVIRRASNLAHYHDVFPYNIQPWAWDYLNKNPELIK
ncbi:superinfection exclusion B family protein [Psychrosphaera ytuae]|uniref:Superinfection exclusion B family protein n=1 Tax=Psychrosphaera ytuae TaxID=2820710 RepID=A0A975DBP0_9GAMM|nr:superinfection exclusion B family protein [Psychrosphaera ytuae]QTH63356.1 superinfection exclusion B family protein [Psychrosphaera ytuae]